MTPNNPTSDKTEYKLLRKIILFHKDVAGPQPEIVYKYFLMFLDKNKNKIFFWPIIIGYQRPINRVYISFLSNLYSVSSEVGLLSVNFFCLGQLRYYPHNPE